MNEPKLYLKIILNFAAAILFLLGLFYLVPPLLRFFMPFVIGWIIAMIANPLVKLMERRIKIMRKHSSAIIIVVVLGAVVGILYWGISLLVRELAQLMGDLPALFAQVELAVDEIALKLKGAYDLLPGGVRGFADNMSDSIGIYINNFIKNMGTPTISDASSVAKSTAEILFISIITILSSYFFIAERENISQLVKANVPRSMTDFYQMITDNFKRAVGGYFKAQLKITVVILVILFAGFEILGVNYSFLLALGIALLDFLPVFGTGAVIWPWALVDLLTGNYMRVVGLMVIYFTCQVVRQLLQPKLVGDSIGVTPLQTLVFMFAGYRLGGVIGLIIGIPVGMILVSLYRSGLFDRLIRGAKIIIRDLSEYLKF